MWPYLDQIVGVGVDGVGPDAIYTADNEEGRHWHVQEAAWDALSPALQRRYHTWYPGPPSEPIEFVLALESDWKPGDPYNVSRRPWDKYLVDVGKPEAAFPGGESLYLPAEVLVVVWAKLQHTFQCPMLPGSLRIIPVTDIEFALANPSLPAGGEDIRRVAWIVSSLGYGHNVAVVFEKKNHLGPIRAHTYVDHKDEFQPDYEFDEDDVVQSQSDHQTGGTHRTPPGLYRTR
jgi:hypothetical protein